MKTQTFPADSAPAVATSCSTQNAEIGILPDRGGTIRSNSQDPVLLPAFDDVTGLDVNLFVIRDISMASSFTSFVS